MDVLIPVAVVSGVLALVVGIVVAAMIHEKKRTEAVRHVADGLGLTFHPQGLPNLVSELATFQLFSQGRSKKTTNVIQGTTGDLEVTIVDYQYTTGHGKNSHTWKQTVVCFRSAELSLTPFTLRPQRLFDRLTAMLGWHDIDFEEYPVFSKKYHLRGPSEEAVRKLFRGDVLAWLEGQTPLCLEGNDTRLLVYRSSKRVKPEEMRGFMEEGFQIYALFKGPQAA
jgi:hypothetical protein